VPCVLTLTTGEKLRSDVPATVMIGRWQRTRDLDHIDQALRVGPGRYVPASRVKRIEPVPLKRNKGRSGG
jgi:hypothetical protein